MRKVSCLQKDGGRVRVMCHHHSHFWRELCVRYPDRTGWLVGPRWWSKPPDGVSVALDNDAYQSFSNGITYDFDEWSKFLKKVNQSGIEPLWSLIPDVVGNRETTLLQWKMFCREPSEMYGWKTALAVQDGVSREDVLGLKFQPDVIFVGGTTEWKWKTAHLWCRDFPRVHIGRVNTKRRLWHSQRIGAESCDGSGWFRESTKGKRHHSLLAWLENPTPEPELELYEQTQASSVR